MSHRKATAIPKLCLKSSPRSKLENDGNILCGSPNSIFNFQQPTDDDKILTKDIISRARQTGVLQLNEKGLISVPSKVWEIEHCSEAELKDSACMNDDQQKWWEYSSITTLDLSFNHILHVSKDISKLHSLTHLYLQHNSLETFPDDIQHLHNLQVLNIDHNRLTVLPKCIYRLQKLNILIVSHNLLEEIDDELGDLVTLVSLDLSHNKLCKIPISTCQLVLLTSLYLQSNKITELPPELKFLTGLEIFNVEDNLIPELPTFEFMPGIQILKATKNKIFNFPCLKMCYRLKELHLDHNKIMVITPEMIENLSSLTHLNLSHNDISRIPEEFSFLQNLIFLDVSNNCLTELPATLSKLSNLKFFSVKGNPLSVRQDIINGGTNRLLQYLANQLKEKAFSPSKTKVVSREAEMKDQLPDKYALKKNRALHLRGLSLEIVPESVLADAAEAEVHLIDLSNNSLSDIPAELSKVSKTLEELNIAKNSITNLSENIGLLKKLQFIDLSNNRLTTLPEEFVELQNLREIDLSFNLFTEMPQALFGCQNLERISFENNKISKFNVEGLHRLKRLAILNLTNNDLQQIPPEVGNLNQLIDLQLTGNGIRYPRREILEKDTRSLLCWLRSRIP